MNKISAPFRTQWPREEFPGAEMYVTSRMFLSLHELSHCSVGSLLGVPTHTVNVTTLQSTHDIWDSYAMSPYEVCFSSPGHTTVHNFFTGVVYENPFPVSTRERG